MADIKRLLKLIPTVTNARFMVGCAVGMLLIPVFFAVIGAGPGMFFLSAMLCAFCVMLIVNTMWQVEFSGLARSSPRRKRLITQAFPKLLFLAELCGFVVLFVTILIAARKFPHAASRTLFVATAYYLAATLFFLTSISVQYKAAGKVLVLYFILYTLGMGVIIWYPLVSDVLFDDSYILSFPDIPPFLTFAGGVFGCFLSACFFACVQRLIYRYSIRQKYLDQLK